MNNGMYLIGKINTRVYHSGWNDKRYAKLTRKKFTIRDHRKGKSYRNRVSNPRYRVSKGNFTYGE